jgi:hypothetical protein
LLGGFFNLDRTNSPNIFMECSIMSASLLSNQSATVTSFIDSIGINGTASPTTAGQMAYLGIDHLRSGQVSASDLLAAGADGAKLDVILPWYMGPITSDTLQSFLSQIDPAASVIAQLSRPGEFHPEPLTEPDLNLSIHPARATH